MMPEYHPEDLQADESQAAEYRAEAAGPRTIGMKISLPGILERAAEHCKKSRDWRTKSLANDLQLLLKHIEIVRAEPFRLQEFLDLWVSD